MTRALSLVLLVACSRGAGPTTEKPEPPQPAPSGPTCATVVAKMREAGIEQLKRGGAEDAQLAEARQNEEKLEPQLVKACIDDGWSAELRTCLDTAPPLEMGDRCENLITPAQMKAVMKIRGMETDDRPPPGT